MAAPPENIPVTVSIKSHADPKERPRRSESLGKIAHALAKAQGEMENAEKDVKGNFGKYATLAATWDAIRAPLAKNEIAIYQRPLNMDGKTFMCTMLIHSSGEFLDDGELELKYDSNGRISAMQAMGSAVTYARRYTLQAATGIAPADDDDGSGAGNPKPPPQNQQQSAPKNHAPQRSKSGARAPASDDTIDVMYSLARERGGLSAELTHVMHNCYGVSTGGKPEQFMVDEVIKVLENEDATGTTLMAHGETVKKRIAEAKAKAGAQ